MEKFTNTDAINLFCEEISAIYERNAAQKIKTIELTKDVKNLQTLIKNISDHVGIGIGRHPFVDRVGNIG